MNVVGILPAAGVGSRLGGEPKAFRQLGRRTVLEHAIARLRAGGVDEIVIAVAPDRLEAMLSTNGTGGPVRWVTGGATRQASVQACLAVIDAGPETLLVVHDAARPVVSPSDIRRTIGVATTADGAVLGRSVVDTVKRVEEGRILDTIDRASLFRAETPQVFRRRVLEAAYLQASETGFVGTDEASLVERNPGWTVLAVEAQYPNPKLTYPADWPWVERLAGASDPGGDELPQLSREGEIA